MNIFPNNRMRMAAVKRILCLVITIVISLQAVPFASADESPEDAEYARAFEQGYVALSRKETDPGEPVSSAEYKAMLADLITQIHPESLE